MMFKKEIPGASGISCNRGLFTLSSPHSVGDGDIMAPPEAILSMLRQTDRRGEWDKMFKEGSVVEAFSESLRIPFVYLL